MSKPKRTTVPVTRRAVIQRVNRALAAEGEKLKVTRGMKAYVNLGDYYSVHLSGGYVLRKHVDLERLARELGVLAKWESVEE